MTLTLSLILSTILSTTTATVISSTGHNATFHLHVPPSLAMASISVAFEKTCIMFDVSTGSPNEVATYDNEYRDRISAIDHKEGNIEFTLQAVSDDDAGCYVCLDDKREVITDCEDFLIVLKEPTEPKIQGKGTSLLGTSLNLNCISSSRSLPTSHNLTMVYTWRRNNQTLAYDSVSAGSSLVSVNGPSIVISHLHKSDTGVFYACQAEEVLGKKSLWSTPVVLTVEYGPTKANFYPEEEFLSLREGGSVNVQCFSDCQPNCTVVWWDREKREVVTSGKVECMLNVAAIDRNTSKLFQCNVHNNHGNRSRDFEIHIKYLPSITLFSANNQENLTVNMGEVVSYSCVVVSNTVPDAYLVLDGAKRVAVFDLYPSIFHQNKYNFTYTFANMEPSNHGKYQCQVSNDIGPSQSNFIYINVKCAPIAASGHSDKIKLKVPSSQTQLQIGFNVTAFPVPYSIKWYLTSGDSTHVELPDDKRHVMQQQIIRENSYYYSLDIDPIGLDDFGTYMMKIENTEGSNAFIAFVLQEDIDEGTSTVQIPESRRNGQTNTAAAVVIPIVISATIVIVIGVVIVYRRKKGTVLNRKPDNQESDTNTPMADRRQVMSFLGNTRYTASYLQPTDEAHEYVYIDWRWRKYSDT